MRRQQSQRGFTLIELMVVVAIIAIVSTLIISISSRTYGSNAKNASDQIVSTLNLARMRAVSTRTIHRAVISPNDIQIWAENRTGFVSDGVATNDPFVSRTTIPHGVSVWNASSTVYGTASGTSPTQNTALSVSFTFKPDGSSSGGTLFVRDTNDSQYRVLIYRATGSVYARETW